MQRLSSEFDSTANGTGSTPAALPESPSIFAPGRRGPTAYEVKFLLSEEQACVVESALKPHLALDPYADPSCGGAYRTTSLYTDTPGFDVYHRVGSLARRKFRVRGYGAAAQAFLERKAKRGDRVKKRRSAVPLAELAQLSATAAPEWSGAWFHRQLDLRRLRPVCRIGYERVAYVGTAETHAIRATFDRNVRGELANSWTLGEVGAVPTLFDGQVIAEFKFRMAMPALFKGIVAELGLTPSSVSKYRRFLHASGTVT